MSEKELYYFEVGEVLSHITEVIAEIAKKERESMQTSANLIAWYAKGIEKGDTALGISAFAEQIREKEVRLEAYQKAGLLINESLIDHAEEIQRKCREKRTAEAANNIDSQKEVKK